MEFTGERYVPGAAGQEELYIEHMSRYQFVRGLANGQRVLDVGSGCGYGTHHLATGGAELALGIDKSIEAVEFSRCNYRHPNLSFAVMDAERLSLADRFGLVTCFELIEHVEDAHAVLEGVYQVLDSSGVFVVSTPNKATYVAGGEGGENPFHVREYCGEEFEGLLRGTFPAVRILGQHWVEGTALCAHLDVERCNEVRAARLPAEDGTSACAAADTAATSTFAHGGEPPYFIALCAKQAILDDITPRLEPLAFYYRAVRYERLKEATLQLEREFDQRGQWAQQLDRENNSKDKTIRTLRCELEELRKEFDDRGRWAQRLNGELRQSGALVERLAEENRRLLFV